MIRYRSQKQLPLADFEWPFQVALDEQNRWVKLSQCIPWDELAEGYYRSFSTDQGRPAKDARLVIGAVIIKHKLCLSDEETVQQIQENPYLQYFVGLPGYQMQAPFVPSLFVEIRKRMGQEVFEVFHGAIVDAVERKRTKSKALRADDPDDKDPPASRTEKSDCDDRIVSISQPYVRPIVRGKVNKAVEFGSKLSVSLTDTGLARVDHLRWDAFHEGLDLESQVEAYRKRTGYYPEAVLGDTIYGTQDNRRCLKKLGIRFAGKPLGRPRRVTEANQEELKRLKAQRREEYLQRIPIEGKFGQGKNGYRLNYIRAKRADTSSAWINSIFLVMNLLILLKIFFVSWIKAVRQPLSWIWTSAWALFRYRFAGLCFKMPGLAPGERAVLTWVPSF